MINTQLKYQISALNQIDNLGLGNIRDVHNVLMDRVSEINRMVINPGVIEVIQKNTEIWRKNFDPELTRRFCLLSRDVAKILEENLLSNIHLEELNQRISGLSKIIDINYNEKLIETLNQMSDIFRNNAEYVVKLAGVLDDEDFEDCLVNEDGSLSCAGEIIYKDEIRESFIDFLDEIIDNIQELGRDFQKKHKIMYFLIKLYVHFCLAFNMAPMQPVISEVHTIESKINNYESKYFVYKESVRVYKNPNSKSQIIEHISYGETVIAEDSCKGWIKVTISVENKIYHGWIAKCNLLNYERQNSMMMNWNTRLNEKLFIKLK